MHFIVISVGNQTGVIVFGIGAIREFENQFDQKSCNFFPDETAAHPNHPRTLLAPCPRLQNSLDGAFHRLSAILIAKLTASDTTNNTVTITMGGTPGTLMMLSSNQSICW